MLDFFFLLFLKASVSSSNNHLCLYSLFHPKLHCSISETFESQILYSLTPTWDQLGSWECEKDFFVSSHCSKSCTHCHALAQSHKLLSTF